jgi:hypothetical protein
MKNSIYYLAVAIIISLSSCAGCSSEPQVSSYETRYSPNGDSTVYIHYVDNSGRDQSFFMDYLLFSTLYAHGGYGSCYGYYNNHPGYFHSPRYQSYSSYHSRTVINNHYGNSSSNNRSRISSPSSPSRSTSSYRSSSSSSPSRSYSSPSRSYSSPSRSYSSPSRSYSSPSRSSFHSSPSRH